LNNPAFWVVLFQRSKLGHQRRCHLRWEPNGIKGFHVLGGGPRSDQVKVSANAEGIKVSTVNR
jgi:hypothetical protein